MALGINYHLDTMQDAYDKWVSAEGKKEQEKAAFKRRQEKAARQKMKSDMLMVGHAALAIGTMGASIPYQAQFGGMANRAVMGDDYEGSQAQKVQNIGSTAYSVSNLNKAKAIEAAEKKYNARLKNNLELAKTMPADMRVGFINRIYDHSEKFDQHMENLDPGFLETLNPNYRVDAPITPKMNPVEIDPGLAEQQGTIEVQRLQLGLDSKTGKPMKNWFEGVEPTNRDEQQHWERKRQEAMQQSSMPSRPDNLYYDQPQSFNPFIAGY